MLPFRLDHDLFTAGSRLLIIELDGSQHLEQEEYDDERTRFFESKGYRVLWSWNNDVMNSIDRILKFIWSVLRDAALLAFLQ